MRLTLHSPTAALKIFTFHLLFFLLFLSSEGKQCTVSNKIVQKKLVFSLFVNMASDSRTIVCQNPQNSHGRDIWHLGNPLNSPRSLFLFQISDYCCLTMHHFLYQTFPKIHHCFPDSRKLALGHVLQVCFKKVRKCQLRNVQLSEITVSLFICFTFLNHHPTTIFIYTKV